ncbi:ABC transporter permease [Nocardioides sp.]|uniref:ABC transporter permease n=1 Tax=Nocardioides sp. TaxID=35761 RepID=UPI00321BBCEC
MSPLAPTGRLSTAAALSRLLPYWLTVTRRTWRGSVVSSFLTPVFYVVAMGVLLGGFIDGDPERLDGATSYLAFIVPGLVAAHAMQTAVADTSWPVFSNFKWNKVYDSMVATPITVRQVAIAHLSFVALRVAATCAVFDLVVAAFGVFETWWGPFVALAAQALTGAAFATLMYGFACRIDSDAAFGVVFRIGIFPLFLFSGAFFPVSNLGAVGERLAQLTPLWHGVNLSRMFSIDRIDWSLAALNLGVLLAVLVIGSRWAVSGLEKRLTT